MRFNTQPPEGGWDNPSLGCQFGVLFQHTAARRRLASADYLSDGQQQFQHTAARRRLASSAVTSSASKPFQHTAARRRLEAVLIQPYIVMTVSTHSRPKAAGMTYNNRPSKIGVSTHSRPKAAGASLKSLAPSGFAAPISLSSQEKREREYNTAFSVTPAFAIS